MNAGTIWIMTTDLDNDVLVTWNDYKLSFAFQLPVYHFYCLERLVNQMQSDKETVKMKCLVKYHDIYYCL